MSTAAAAAEAPPPAAKGKKKLIILIAAAVLLLGGGGGAAFVLLKKKPAAEDGDEAAHVEKAEPKAKPAAKHDAKHPPAFSPLEPFTVNLADKEVERYAQVQVTLELDDAKTADDVKNFMPAIRNNILMVLAHKTSAQLLSAEGKTKLAGEIQRATSRALGFEVDEPDDDEAADDGDKPKKKKKKRAAPALPIVAVHFSNFIVQ
ncbi:MAG: flagellar basal body-associated FliL family protein [Proteobacteria bacterium]|nr:flagellar basal body-associated FliL family protein [Pseudomonadota bacterium]